MLTLCFLPSQRSWSWARPPRPLPTAPPLSEHFLVLLLSILTPLYTWPRCVPDPNHGISMWPCSHVPGGTFVTFPCAFCASLSHLVGWRRPLSLHGHGFFPPHASRMGPL